MYFGDHQVRGKWGLHLEGQWRRNQVVTQPQQLLLRTGVNYQINERVMFTQGYGYVKAYPYGQYPAKFGFPEHRFYQQLLVKQKTRDIRLQHRFRLEQRFLGQVVAAGSGGSRLDSWRYQNRFRYFFKAEVPLGKTGERKNWYGAFYDEIFFNFVPKHGASAFDQNRAYAALGHTLGKTGKIEIGYLNQLIVRRNSPIREINHTFQLAIFSNLAFGK